MATNNKDTTKVAAKKRAAKVPAKRPKATKQTLDLQAAVKAELKAEAAAAKAEPTQANAPVIQNASLIQPMRRPPVLRAGAGEVISAAQSGPVHHVHKLRRVMVALMVILVVAVGVWGGLQYMHYRNLHSPAKQAALFKQYDNESTQLDLLRRYNEEAASLQEYLGAKPDQPYHDKAVLKLANALLKANRADEALKQYQKIESVQALQLDVHRGMSKAYLSEGNKERAHYYQQQVVDAVKAKQDSSSRLQLLLDEAQLRATNQ